MFHLMQLPHSTVGFPSQVCQLHQKSQPCVLQNLLKTGMMVWSQTYKNMFWKQKRGDFSDSLEWKVFYSWVSFLVGEKCNHQRAGKEHPGWGGMPSWLSIQTVISRSISSQQSEWNDSSETWKEKCLWHPIIKGPCVPWQGNSIYWEGSGK